MAASLTTGCCSPLRQQAHDLPRQLGRSPVAVLPASSRRRHSASFRGGGGGGGRRAGPTVVFALFGGLGGGGASDLALLTAVHNIPHPEKVEKGGEDAWYVKAPEAGAGGGGSVGIADGVGGYGRMGIDSGLYSKQLMRVAAETDDRMGGMIDPSGILAAAQDQTLVPGASTACVIQLQGRKATLHAANLGDSGFIILRDNKLLLKSDPLQHYFDCPYQMCDQNRAPSETAADAQIYELKVSEGDIVITASDGLFDNVFEEEIISVVNSTLDQHTGSKLTALQETASALASVAYDYSSDEQYESPYAKDCFAEDKSLAEAQAKKLENLPGPFGKVLGGLAGTAMGTLKCELGGKPDDITILISEVVKAKSCAEDLEASQTKANAVLDPIRERLDKDLKAFKAKEAGSKPPKPTKELPKADVTFTEDEIEAMDKKTLQNILQQYGQPTSGRLEKLKERVASFALKK